MTIGTLGTPALLGANTPVLLYTVPAGKSAVVNINLVNISKSEPVLVRIAITEAATPTVTDWLEYDVYLTPSADISNSNQLERTGVAIQGNAKVFVYASVAASVVGRVHGMEK